MASETVNGQADLLLAKLGEKAKAYRLTNINKRIAESSSWCWIRRIRRWR